MITRIWHGRTSVENAEYYRKLLSEKGTKEYLETPGNISAKVWTRPGDNCVHCWTVTEWDNIDSIKAFAGDDYEKAKYYPEDDGILLEFEEKVEHYHSEDVSNAKVRMYVQQFVQNYEGGSWQAENFIDKLNDVDESLAFQQPMPGVHSVAEIVWHCCYWRTVLINSLNGDYGYRERTMGELNFLPLEAVRKKGWKTLLSDLELTQKVLLVMLGRMRDRDLLKEYTPGHTFDHMIVGIVQHDIYHLGQIGLVKKIVSTNKNLSPL